jgi:hypothetical protein
MSEAITPTIPTEGAVEEVKEAPEANVDSEETPSLLDEANAEEKATQAAEEKRILEAKEEDLSQEDKTKKAEIVAAQKAAKENVVPEKYVFKVPEGMTLDQEYADKASAVMKKHGITQAAATELGEMAAVQIQKITAQKEAADKVNFNNFVEGLKQETLKELGANAKQELVFAAKSRDRLASPELVEKLNKSGLANDIDVIRHFIKIGKEISEGKLIEGKTPGADGVNPLDVLYPKTKTT